MYPRARRRILGVVTVLVLRSNGYDISLFANNILDQHPLLFETRDIATIKPTTSTSHAASAPAP